MRVEIPGLAPRLNEKFVSRSFVLSAKYREYKENARLYVPVRAKRYTTPIYMCITFFVSRDRDIDSGVKVVLDSLEGLCYDNDSQITELKVIKVKCKKGKERTLITISGSTEFREVEKLED